jgi:lipoprotein signal peptidase
VLILASGAFGFLVADQASKHVAVRLGLARSGSCFWLRTSQPARIRALLLFTVLVIVALAVAVEAFSGVAFSTLPARLGIGAAVGGASGNVIDRLRRDAVVDFISMGRWPAFNVADVAIVGGSVAALSSLPIGLS